MQSSQTERVAQTRIYLDHAATTPLSPEARAAMEPWLEAGNASSLYAEGRAAKAALDKSREVVADNLGCLFAETIFTSGGTESAVMAIVGAALANDGPRRRVLMSAAEHHCVLHTIPILERLGYEVGLIPVTREAIPDLNCTKDLLRDDVLLISAMRANNELGTLTDTNQIADLAHRHGALLHVDAVQSFRSHGYENETVDQLGADLLSVSSHKIYGPKGVGALYIRAGVKIKPIFAGGGQERELRGGTENVAAIVGFGAAADLPTTSNARDARDGFEQELLRLGALATATSEHRLLGHCHVRFPGIDADTLLIALDRLGVSAGSGAACSSGSVEPSHVLAACGYSPAESRQGVRFTFGRSSTLADAIEGSRRVGLAIERVHSARP